MIASRHLAAIGVFFCLATHAMAGEWAGYLGAEYLYFAETPLDAQQYGSDTSFAVQPEYHSQWDDRRQTFDFTAFARADAGDPQRTHTDLRELSWRYGSTDWEIRAGVRKVFWGVTESQHLVDIVNQTDSVEGIDGEEKLGQPMLNLALIQNWGTLDLFVLPYFRERTFPGINGRLRTSYRVATELVQYESSERERHIDYAARWRSTLGKWDLGLSYFSGTSRDPTMSVGVDANSKTVFIPSYKQITQYGIDAQATLDNWLWKLEVMQRQFNSSSYQAATGGFEYSFYDVAQSGKDLGVVLEYLYDSRGSSATTPFEDDLFLGLRLTWNDVASSEALAGLILDRDTQATITSVEASRRFGEHWKLNLEARAFTNIPAGDAYLSALSRDDFLRLTLRYYF